MKKPIVNIGAILQFYSLVCETTHNWPASDMQTTCHMYNLNFTIQAQCILYGIVLRRQQ